MEVFFWEPRNAWAHQKLRYRAKKESPGGPLEEAWPCCLLISDLWLPDLQEDTFLPIQATQFTVACSGSTREGMHPSIKHDFPLYPLQLAHKHLRKYDLHTSFIFVSLFVCCRCDSKSASVNQSISHQGPGKVKLY